MNVIQVNAKEPHGPNFGLQIAVESQPNRLISEAINTGDEKWVRYNVKRKW